MRKTCQDILIKPSIEEKIGGGEHGYKGSKFTIVFGIKKEYIKINKTETFDYQTINQVFGKVDT